MILMHLITFVMKKIKHDISDEEGQLLKYFQKLNAVQISHFCSKIHENLKVFLKELICYLRRELYTNTIA